MITYDPASPLISLHVPKTGGTSIVSILKSWFPDGRLLMHSRPEPGQLPPRYEIGSGVCVHGHFNSARGFGVAQYYPQARQFITFLRDPFDRFLSLWYFLHRQPDKSQITNERPIYANFESFLRAQIEALNANTNSQTMIIQMPRSDGGLPGRLFDEQFVFVGIMERYQASVDALSLSLGKPMRTVERLNSTERTGPDLSKWRPIYEAAFTVDMELYEAALSRNAELLRAFRA